MNTATKEQNLILNKKKEIIVYKQKSSKSLKTHNKELNSHLQ